MDEKNKKFKNSLTIIDPRRTLLLSGNFGENEADGIVTKLFELGKDAEKGIYLQINSKGGSYVGGMKIYDAMRNTQATITGIVTGDAFSMAAIVLQGCDHRAATKNSRILFHHISLDPHLKIEPDSKVADFSKRLQEEIDELIGKNEAIKEILAERVTEDFGDLDLFLKAERILPARRALLLNLIDEII